MKKIVLFIFLIQILGISKTYGKCPFVYYIISGEVKDEKNSQPLEGVCVYIFFDNYDLTYANDYSYYPDFFITNHEGKFKGISRYFKREKLNLLLFKYNCKDFLEVEVILIKPDNLTKRIKFIRKNLKIIKSLEKNIDESIEIPTIKMASSGKKTYEAQ